ncbi:MAG: serine hydrolase [Balneolaceae bacterium]
MSNTVPKVKEFIKIFSDKILSPDTFYVFPVILLLALLFVATPYLFVPDNDSETINSPNPSEISALVPIPIPEETAPPMALEEIVKPMETLGPVSSILISQHGQVISEEYFGSMHAERAHNIKSASKSILSILTGIAIDQGFLDGVDQKIADFFPEYFSENTDSVKASITIGDLLTMRSGLASTSRSNYGAWVTSNNWIQYALSRPMRGTPGKDRIYSTGNTHLLSVILARASGMSTLEFANRYLFRPMDIQVGGWDRDPQGYFLGGNNMALRPRDLIKLGRLMMNTGTYNDEQLVPSDWIIHSVEPVTGRNGRINYGYLWFTRSAGDYHMVYAFGHGGQYLMMLPELDAVITVTTRNGGNESTRNYRRNLFSSIDREIIPHLEYSYTPD